MRIIKFEIKNFKGVSKTEINLSDEVPGNIITLIGLNESGKTTILEALSHFITGDEDTAYLVETVQETGGMQDIIPKDRKAAFTGEISIKAFVELDDSDLDSLEEFFAKECDLILSKVKLSRKLNVTKVYKFVDSEFKSAQSLWSITFPLRSKRARRFREYGSSESTRPTWILGVEHLHSLIPQIVYFPTFLFNLPDRIYLEGDIDPEVNEYYKKVIQDVLDSQGEGLSLQKHVVDRIAKHRDPFPNPTAFIAYLFGLDERTQIDAVMQKISNEMSKIIFGAWSDVLGRTVSNKRLQVDWFLDSEKKNIPYLQVSIIDGQSKYALSERSLGFRWFFSFLLFTQFRRNRQNDSGTIFLFDEPAANLHSKAQLKLLDSFSKIVDDDTYIIYSTHSHYMVNPVWLEKAYIIENKAIDYESEDQMNAFSTQKTDIVSTKYRQFVASNVAKTTYFQPVLDALEVNFSPLERSSKAVIVEGKFDFHPYMYLCKRAGANNVADVFPGTGAGDIGCLINLFRGWGVDFRIILDDDKAGREAKKRYCKEYFVKEEHILTLGEIVPELKGKAFESIYQDDVEAAVKKCFSLNTLKKRHYSLFFQELLVNDKDEKFPKTEKVFLKIAEWSRKTFGS